MRTPWVRRLLLLSVLLAGVAAPARAADETWKAGVAKAVITPQTKVWLAGYGGRRVPDGKLHDLWMKALALEDVKGRRVVLVTSDFQGIPKEMSDRVQQLEARIGQLETENTWLKSLITEKSAGKSSSSDIKALLSKHEENKASGRSSPAHTEGVGTSS